MAIEIREMMIQVCSSMGKGLDDFRVCYLGGLIRIRLAGRLSMQDAVKMKPFVHGLQTYT